MSNRIYGRRVDNRRSRSSLRRWFDAWRTGNQCDATFIPPTGYVPVCTRCAGHWGAHRDGNDPRELRWYDQHKGAKR